MKKVFYALAALIVLGGIAFAMSNTDLLKGSWDSRGPDTTDEGKTTSGEAGAETVEGAIYLALYDVEGTFISGLDSSNFTVTSENDSAINSVQEEGSHYTFTVADASDVYSFEIDVPGYIISSDITNIEPTDADEDTPVTQTLSYKYTISVLDESGATVADAIVAAGETTGRETECTYMSSGTYYACLEDINPINYSVVTTGYVAVTGTMSADSSTTVSETVTLQVDADGDGAADSTETAPEDTSGDADEATPSYTCNSLDLTLGTTGTVDNTYTLAAGAIDPLEPISVFIELNLDIDETSTTSWLPNWLTDAFAALNSSADQDIHLATTSDPETGTTLKVTTDGGGAFSDETTNGMGYIEYILLEGDTSLEYSYLGGDIGNTITAYILGQESACTDFVTIAEETSDAGADADTDTTTDTDGDGITDYEETNTYGTDPTLTDTDGDGMDDAWEIAYEFDPLSNDATYEMDAFGDLDGDGLTNLEEYTYGTDPTLTDTDSDGLTDYAELMTYFTDPTLVDTDGDGVNDGQEITDGTDPLDATSYSSSVDTTTGEIYLVAQDVEGNLITGLAETDFTVTNAGTGVVNSFSEESAYYLFTISEPTDLYSFEIDAPGYIINTDSTDIAGDTTSSSSPATSVLDFKYTIYTLDELGATTDALVTAGTSSTSTDDLCNLIDSGAYYVCLIDADTIFYQITKGGYTTVTGTIAASTTTMVEEVIMVADGTSTDADEGTAPEADTYDSGDDTTDGSGYTCNSLDLTLGTTGTVGNTYTLDATTDPIDQLSSIPVFIALDLTNNDAAPTSWLPNWLTNAFAALNGSADQDIHLATATDLGVDSTVTIIVETDGTSTFIDANGDSATSINQLLLAGNVSLEYSYIEGEIGDTITAYIDGQGTACTDYVTITATDTDSDGLSDYEETNTYGTDPSLADTDGDGMDDGWEVTYGLDPLVDDSASDLDGDGYSNLEEYTAGTDPSVDITDVDTTTDTDSDGITDYEETNTYGTDPTLVDTDGDGMDDAWEITYGLDPLADDSASDLDGDGYTNLDEYTAGYDPSVAASTTTPSTTTPSTTTPSTTTPSTTPSTPPSTRAPQITATPEEVSQVMQNFCTNHPFTDLSGHWGETAICRLYNAGIVSGYDNTNAFGPNNNITRAEWIKIIIGNAGYDEGDASGKTEGFADVNADDWYYEVVIIAQDKDIIRTREGEYFNPNTPITRADAVLYQIRMANQQLWGWDASDIPFSDVSMDDYFAYAVVIANSTTVNLPEGGTVPVIEGYSGNEFKPYNYITRAEAASVAARAWLAWFRY